VRGNAESGLEKSVKMKEWIDRNLMCSLENMKRGKVWTLLTSSLFFDGEMNVGIYSVVMIMIFGMALAKVYRFPYLLGMYFAGGFEFFCLFFYIGFFFFKGVRRRIYLVWQPIIFFIRIFKQFETI